ncbi:MAG: thiamine phosphate synthase [Microbacteriaceae bacterium]|jgi:thiamine-phosphate diphosphorylase|nr:thiamine phosphate synthase [Microbacteriaceae bacterium]MCI1207336.1 thiamine phosphate synthase [Microbacteriaceae bacterium]
MNVREHLDISSYLVVGPENTNGRPVTDIVRAAVRAGFTCVQIRSKVAGARELIDLTSQAADVIAEEGRTGRTALVVDDRLDVVLAARHRGVAVDGVHVGQSDIPVDVCRAELGPDAVVGLSGRTHELLDYIATVDVTGIDYFGVGPLHRTETKPDCGLDVDGTVITRSLEEITRVCAASPIPVVVGGGVHLEDLAGLARTGADGYFLVSAVAGATDPAAAASALVAEWRRSLAAAGRATGTAS